MRGEAHRPRGRPGPVPRRRGRVGERLDAQVRRVGERVALVRDGHRAVDQGGEERLEPLGDDLGRHRRDPEHLPPCVVVHAGPRPGEAEVLTDGVEEPPFGGPEEQLIAGSVYRACPPADPLVLGPDGLERDACRLVGRRVEARHGLLQVRPLDPARLDLGALGAEDRSASGAEDRRAGSH